MKATFFSLLLLVFAAVFTHAQTDCEGYLPFKEGLTFEHTHYDAKGKVTSVNSATFVEIKAADAGFRGTVAYRMSDGKKKESGEGSYVIECIGGVLKMDLSSMMNPAMTEAYQSMEMTMSGDGLQFPSSLEVGDVLPDGQTRIDVASNGVSIVTLAFESKNRKVEAREEISTPAGTYDCFRIREEITYNAMFLNRSYAIVGWYAKGIGLVKQETYDAKGVMSSWMELTKWGR
jgi:hypothetical protein